MSPRRTPALRRTAAARTRDDAGTGPPADSVSAVERKEKVLHTRVPGSLDRQLRRRARSLGMSVSTIVRHVLLNTFGLVEDIVADSTNVALSIAGADEPDDDRPFQLRDGRAAAPTAPADGAADVVAWHEAVLNRNAVCERCNAILPKRTNAAFGLREGAGPHAILCVPCLHATTGISTKGPSSPATTNRRASKRRTRE